MVELFTSEGCSSCPPAEAYLGELAQRPEVLALAYHVDYWDDLGWHDRFGLPQAVQRQRAYAIALGLSTVYTPQAVIDGQGNFTGSDRRSIAKALEKPRSGVPISLSTSGGEVVVGLPAQVMSHRAMWCWSLISAPRSHISAAAKMRTYARGIQHRAGLTQPRKMGREKGQYHCSASSLPREATDVAVIVQPLGQAPIIGAAASRCASSVAYSGILSMHDSGVGLACVSNSECAKLQS